MNKELSEVVKLYATATQEEVTKYLLGCSKINLVAMLADLVTMYINDKNSSTLREFITVSIAGYEHEKRKIGYNGYKHDSIVPGRVVKCEAKPKNISTEDFRDYERGRRSTRPQKLNGGGNFTDYTPDRFEKDKKENPNILVSGFIDGKLIYIIEFPFNIPEFVANLQNQIQKWIDKLEESSSMRGQFLRSATFDYRHYINNPNTRVVYLAKGHDLDKYKDYFVKKFYDKLISMTL